MMPAYEIRTFEDLVEILRSEPKWREELRRLILTDELLELPKQFQDFKEKVEERFERLENDVAKIKEDVERIKEDVIRTKEDVGKIEKRLDRLESDVARLKGDSFERKVREKAYSFLGKIITKCKVVDMSIIAEKLDEAVYAGIITEEEKDSALKLDVLAEGFLRDDREKKVLVAVEVSVKADRNDVERAKERSQILEKALGLPVIPVVISEGATFGAKEKAKELNVELI